MNIHKKIFAAASAILAMSGHSYAQCISGDCEDGYGVYIYDSGERYDGFWRDGECHGQGTMIMDNGDTYIGRFRKGEFNGIGTYIWAEDGSKYTGHWQNGDRHGIGTYIAADGTSETTIWEDDDPLDSDEKVTGCVNGTCERGFGVYINDDGSVYEGYWKNGKPNGQGKVTFYDGSIYEGEFLNGKFNGFGALRNPDGSGQAGRFEDGTFIGEINPATVRGEVSGNCVNGYGIYVFDSGNYYMGYWKNDKRHGQGTMYFTDGEIQEGTWDNNELSGQVRITYNKEHTLYQYIGDFTNGGANGYGTMIWKDGSVYYGQVKNGKANGQGVLIDTEQNNRRIIGVFRNNERVQEMSESSFDLIFGSKNGYGIRLTEWGRYSGNLRNGIPNGQGTLLCNNGVTIAGKCFVNGQVKGSGMIENPATGIRYVGQISQASANGEGTIYYSDGTTWAGEFKDGEPVKNTENYNTNVAKPEASWTAPQYYNTETTDMKTKVELCVTSQTPIQEVIVYVNNEVKAKHVPSRGFKTVTSKCDFSYEFDLELQPGDNVIKADIKNEGGVYTTDIRTITVKKSDKVSEQKRLALVIGNGAYSSVPPLQNAANDAKLMTTTLRGLGFEVMSGTDLTKEQMKKLIRDFAYELEDTKAVGLFFYAGHGLQAGGENYIVPVDAQIKGEEDYDSQCVTLNRVLGSMEQAKNDLNIIILDACRNNPFPSKTSQRAINGTNDGGLAAINAPKGTFIAFATAPGSTASDGTGNNGLYTSKLAKEMSAPGVKIEDVFKKVRNEVYQESERQQVPWENSSIFGDFYFKK